MCVVSLVATHQDNIGQSEGTMNRSMAAINDITLLESLIQLPTMYGEGSSAVLSSSLTAAADVFDRLNFCIPP